MITSGGGYEWLLRPIPLVLAGLTVLSIALAARRALAARATASPVE